MGFLSSLKGLIKHEPVVTTAPMTSKKTESIPLTSQKSISHLEEHTQQITPLQTRVTTQHPIPSTPSPRAHA